ncbi:unnamed protein product [Rotaria sordida]|uniref:Uncharacterized protein n=1 Tax=Rotaria sordida TaxID=392033 RepID=A0A813WTI8_9BILA|nr:unnamed protein product [Rotaria sordida]CAF0827485.1 unnamed protein product [Rotaria sordida]CAF0860383.1 unnamed protein product [Rotaria sordida]CAF3531256.1 unnamed protein product [Rotaria sordida]CAF3721209.1 unnamed protein product [Rotaria sordida]
MYEYERINKQLNDYYSFATSLLNFLQKYLIQFHKSLINYSMVLKHLHKKSTNLLIKTNSNHELTKQLHHAFLSLTQTFDDEYHHLEQRASLIKIIQLTIENLKQKINSSIILKQKNKLHKYTYCIIRLNRNKKRQYLYQLVQQIRKHDKLTLTWKDNLDNITSQTTNLIWKLFSYSPYKFDIKPLQTSSSSISISETNVDLPCIENDKQNAQLSSSTELGSGDQLQLKSIKETILHESEQEQKQISNSNNALIIPVNLKRNCDENRSLYSTDIDETIVEKNRLHNDFIDDEDDRWIKLVKQNEIQWQQTRSTLSILTDQSSDDNESIIKQYNTLIKTKNSLHLSDLSYTTDYYSQNESD